jgi:hypothetical protein
MRIGAADRHQFNGSGENDFIQARRKFDLASQKRPQFGRRLLAMMNDPYSIGYQPTIGELTAQANDRYQPKFNVVTIRLTFDADVVEGNRGFLGSAEFE